MRARSDESDALIESALDRELKAALDVDPSPEFLARVRMRLASEPEPSAWHLPWLFAAAGAIAIVVAVVVVASRFDEPSLSRSADVVLPAERPATVAGEARTGTLVAAGSPARGPDPKVSPEALVGRGFSPAVVRPAVSGSGGSHLEVLISPDEIRGLRRLIAMANEQDANLGSFLAEPTILATVGPDGEITVPPISIDPLVSDIDSDTY